VKKIIYSVFAFSDVVSHNIIIMIVDRLSAEIVGFVFNIILCLIGSFLIHVNIFVWF